MRPPVVVMGGACSKYRRNCRSPKISTRSVTSVRTVRTKRSAKQARVGFQNSRMTCDQWFLGRGFVFVDQPAEDRATPDRAVDRLGDRRLRTRRMQLQRSMGSSSVVVR